MNERSKIASALKAAKPFLAEDFYDECKQTYICYAIREAAARGKCSLQARDDAQMMIIKRLGGRYNIETWLQDRIGLQKYFAAKLRNPDVIQEYRHRWLDELIREFSEKN